MIHIINDLEHKLEEAKEQVENVRLETVRSSALEYLQERKETQKLIEDKDGQINDLRQQNQQLSDEIKSLKEGCITEYENSIVELKSEVKIQNLR